MKKFFNNINTVITIIGTVYTVTKFMFDTFKKYERKHGRGNIFEQKSPDGKDKL